MGRALRGPEGRVRRTLSLPNRHDLYEAMRRDWPSDAPPVLRVDGGMTANDWMLQGLADILGAPVDRPKVRETTAMGAAWLAGKLDRRMNATDRPAGSPPRPIRPTLLNLEKIKTVAIPN